jgi:Domain of Unknown Function (DUF1543)
MKLYAVYVGGEVEGGNIEVHDMRFVAASSLRETYTELIKQWWGKPGSLHIDCWAEITHADGYEVSLRPEPFAGPLRLYYVNMGGYDKTQFTEVHRNMFVVAQNVTEAKRRAKAAIVNWDQPHRDDMYEADQAFCLSDKTKTPRLHIHLTPAETAKPLEFTCRYIRLDRQRRNPIDQTIL